MKQHECAQGASGSGHRTFVQKIAAMAISSMIQDALYRYCRAIDRQERALLGQVFHTDAVIDNGHFKRGPADFSRMATKRHTAITQVSHMVANVLIDFMEPCKAFVESYRLALEHRPHCDAGPLDRVAHVRYADVFERRAQAWRVAHRNAVIDHEMSCPASTATPARGGRMLAAC